MSLCQRIINNWLLSFLIVFTFKLNGFTTVNGDDSNIVLFNKIDNCKSSEYFDVNYFACRLCDPQMGLIPAKNGLNCTCHPQALSDIIYDNSVRNPICRLRDCSNSTNCTSSNDPSAPQNCTIYSIRESFSFLQPAKSIRIVRSACENTSNSCPLNNIRYHDYCIPLTLLDDYFNYKQFKTIQSPIVDDIYANLDILVFLCHAMHISVHCEHVANLCVLSQYSLERFSPCNIFFASQTSVIGNGGVDGFQSRVTPFLFYAKGKNTIDDIDKPLDQRYRYGKKSHEYYEDATINNEISIVVVGHSVDGDLKAIESFRLSDFNLCENVRNDRIHFGENLVSMCRLDLQTLLRHGERRPWIMNLYLNYTENRFNLMKAIPVLIRNSFSHNMNPFDRERWQLVKRFYLVDIFTSRNRTYKSHRFENDENFIEKFTTVRYVRRMEIRFNLHENHYYFGNKLSVPLIAIEYGEIDVHEYRLNPFYEIEFEFTVTFNKPFSMSTFFHIVLSLGIAGAIGAAAFETYSFKTRKQQMDIDASILLKFVIFLCSSIGNVLFGLAVILNLYIYYVFKTQNVVRVLPPFDELTTIKVFYVLALFCKFVKLGHILHRQISSDLFFVDWERPRVFEHQITLKPTNNLDTPSVCSSAKQNDGLSAWRSYFVANEWIRLATKRRSSVSIQILLVFLSLILFHFDVKQLFTFKALFHWPWTSNADRAIRSAQSLEMLASSLILYCCCYFVQRIYHLLFYERIVCDGMQQYVDLCSMANISVFLFVFDAFGFYIHGRSPHGFADTDMCSMIQQLRRESENLCGHRGLLPDSDHQTFSFIAPMQMRILYNKLKISLQQSANVKFGPQNHHENDIETAADFSKANLNQIANGNTTINRFLSAFIDHGLKDLDYTVQEKTFIENIFDFEFETNITENRGTFFIDNGHSFDAITFYGNEILLFLTELLLFLSIIVICGNFLFAILCVGFVAQILQHTIKFFVKRNLSEKTLIDSRFLL